MRPGALMASSGCWRCSVELGWSREDVTAWSRLSVSVESVEHSRLLLAGPQTHECVSLA